MPFALRYGKGKGKILSKNIEFEKVPDWGIREGHLVPKNKVGPRWENCGHFSTLMANFLQMRMKENSAEGEKPNETAMRSSQGGKTIELWGRREEPCRLEDASDRLGKG